MTQELAITLSSELLWLAIKVMAPVLGLTMLVGLVISFFQVITQIQEMTLTFIPKLAIAAFSLIAFGGWMLAILVDYARELIANIPNMF
ncbi:MAG: flagellar biosynthesis protein FliQ [Saccharospirillaceae bacterium]|nr:flagellar biosynthesis protein FliQ [Pseudomonadales bacterium]NRB79748.1 flagellar biosynthesis protein FliQ [Saccharospirillaceae bacterium]